MRRPRSQLDVAKPEPLAAAPAPVGFHYAEKGQRDAGRPQARPERALPSGVGAERGGAQQRQRIAAPVSSFGMV